MSIRSIIIFMLAYLINFFLSEILSVIFGVNNITPSEINIFNSFIQSLIMYVLSLLFSGLIVFFITGKSRKRKQNNMEKGIANAVSLEMNKDNTWENRRNN